MNKRIVVIIAECIPVISAIISLTLILGPSNESWLTPIIYVTTLLAFFGIVFFFVGRKLVKGDTIIRVLGILDIAATGSIVLLYVIAIFTFGL